MKYFDFKPFFLQSITEIVTLIGKLNLMIILDISVLLILNTEMS